MPLGTRWPMSQAMDFWYLTAELLCIKSEHLSFNLICSLFVCVWYVCMFVHLCACQWLPQCVCGGQRETLGKPSTSFKTGSPGCSKLCMPGSQPASLQRVSCLLSHLSAETLGSQTHATLPGLHGSWEFKLRAPTEPSPHVCIVFYPNS